MKKEMRPSEKILLSGFCFILLFMIFHDWLPLGPFNDVEAVSGDRSLGELVTVTLIGGVQILLFLGAIVFFRGRKYPIWIKIWLVIHQTSIFTGALLDWWIPYFFGYGADERVERYELMFGDTHSFLPVMNGIVPNTIHVLFHAALLMCIILTIYISFTDRRSKMKSNMAVSS
ncbi:hypothetical protein [Fredinandcohnia quinoae]|uniref:Uncharacterized protein n=1 Tax=Fredinandcohnia quinoae TaxID=2918902 RepID=A0AAW5EC82_9BACI|nr:hypothetical protein [Fredinandcohnia sp. SECRCQ15]MCH1627502.1 hypothetical protein [Fredinandcohnia sp. SECRCQ15]